MGHDKKTIPIQIGSKVKDPATATLNRFAAVMTGSFEERVMRHKEFESELELYLWKCRMVKFALDTFGNDIREVLIGEKFKGRLPAIFVENTTVVRAPEGEWPTLYKNGFVLVQSGPGRNGTI